MTLHAPASRHAFVPFAVDGLLLGVLAFLAGCATEENGKYRTVDAAQAHCPDSQVLWLNSRVNLYHRKGNEWYGKTAHGAYVCESDMAKVGGKMAPGE